MLTLIGLIYFLEDDVSIKTPSINLMSTMFNDKLINYTYIEFIVIYINIQATFFISVTI